MTTAHAVYAPSSAHRWTKCTASASAIAALGPDESGPEAEEGTAAHDEIERILGHLTDIVPDAEMMQRGLALDGDPDHPAAYGIDLVIDYVRQLPPGRMWIEQRVRLTDQIWGRCDVAHWDPASFTLTIVDYKNGFVNVEAEENEQLQIYAAAAIMTWQLPALWIRLVVVQPNSWMPGPRVKQWVTSAESLHRFASTVAAIPGQPLTFTAGEQCRYCPLFGRCPASSDVLVRLGVALSTPPDAVPTGQVAIFKACEKPIADWFKALDKAATKKALAGAVPPGMKLITTQKHRAWKDANAARVYLATECGLEVFDPPSPAQAEALVPKEWVAANCDRPDGGPALVFESDTRPAWARKSAAEMFKAAVAAEQQKEGAK